MNNPNTSYPRPAVPQSETLSDTQTATIQSHVNGFMNDFKTKAKSNDKLKIAATKKACESDIETCYARMLPTFGTPLQPPGYGT